MQIAVMILVTALATVVAFANGGGSANTIKKAAAPTSQPTTKSYAELKADLVVAEGAVKSAREEALKTTTDKAYRKAVYGERETQKALDRAKANRYDSPEHRAAAVEPLERKLKAFQKDKGATAISATDNDPKVKAAEKKAGEIEARVKGAREADPILEAMEHHELIEGMTLDQANESIGKEGKLVFSSGGVKVYSWQIIRMERSGPAGAALRPRREATYTATFDRDGKIREFSQD